LAPRYPAAGASRRSGLPARDFRALGAGAEGGGFLQQSRSDLLAASVAPRSGAAKPEEQQINARHIFAALATAAEPDRHLDRQAGRYRGQYRAGARPRLPRRDAASGYQARPLRVHAAGRAAGWGFRDGVISFHPSLKWRDRITSTARSVVGRQGTRMWNLPIPSARA